MYDWHVTDACSGVSCGTSKSRGENTTPTSQDSTSWTSRVSPVTDHYRTGETISKKRWVKAFNVIRATKKFQKVRFILDPKLHGDINEHPVSFEDDVIAESSIYYFNMLTNKNSTLTTNERYFWKFVNSGIWSGEIYITEGKLQSGLLEHLKKLVGERKAVVFKTIAYTGSNTEMKRFFNHGWEASFIKKTKNIKKKVQLNHYKITREYYCIAYSLARERIREINSLSKVTGKDIWRAKSSRQSTLVSSRQSTLVGSNFCSYSTIKQMAQCETEYTDTQFDDKVSEKQSPANTEHGCANECFEEDIVKTSDEEIKYNNDGNERSSCINVHTNIVARDISVAKNTSDESRSGTPCNINPYDKKTSSINSSSVIDSKSGDDKTFDSKTLIDDKDRPVTPCSEGVAFDIPGSESAAYDMPGSEGAAYDMLGSDNISHTFLNGKVMSKAHADYMEGFGTPNNFVFRTYSAYQDKDFTLSDDEQYSYEYSITNPRSSSSMKTPVTIETIDTDTPHTIDDQEKHVDGSGNPMTKDNCSSSINLKEVCDEIHGKKAQENLALLLQEWSLKRDEMDGKKYFLSRINEDFIEETLHGIEKFKVYRESITDNLTWKTISEIVVEKI